MNTSMPIEFKVTYRLSEYLHIVRARAFALSELKETLGATRLAYGAILTVAWVALFFYKSWRVGTCSFAIDEAGISRRSKSGLIFVSWSEVSAVREYEVGYLVEKGEGAMPVPFRVLSVSQRKLLSALVAPHLQAPVPATGTPL